MHGAQSPEVVLYEVTPGKYLALSIIGVLEVPTQTSTLLRFLELCIMLLQYSKNRVQGPIIFSGVSWFNTSEITCDHQSKFECDR